MSRNTPARHRAATDGNLALQGLSRAVKGRATAVGRPVAIVAVTSGLALTAIGTAHAGSSTEQGTVSASAAVAAPVVSAPAVPAPAVPTAVAPAAAAVAAAGLTHTVVPGDTLGGISASYGVELAAVLSVNSLSVASIIFPGDSITMPAGDAVQAPVQSVTIAAVPTAAVAPAAVQQAPTVAPAPAASTTPGSGVYLASADITPVASTSGVAGTLVASAQSQLAAGAVQDCTVLVEKALRAAGISVGDLGPSQFFQFGATVATPAPGDLVITGGHVAIYVGGGQVISSGMNGANLTLQHPLSDLSGASFVRVAG
ncbi:LysM peptidoglycan-binding domain-containing protein [Arthrobacter sp. B1805]|uniref:C40 family peptidase n=1 Tax=Arthrobacter sp. B1805 TaxID=2058892 RepID=UPI000CE52545|nr:LysM peptidoglycan-binding domain-containing protein [Arthrobacter sp. B1805]